MRSIAAIELTATIVSFLEIFMKYSLYPIKNIAPSRHRMTALKRALERLLLPTTALYGDFSID